MLVQRACRKALIIPEEARTDTVRLNNGATLNAPGHYYYATYTVSGSNNHGVTAKYYNDESPTI